MTDHVGYGAAAPYYQIAGWRCVLPLPRGAKKSPPKGWTGYAGETPSSADIYAWTEEHADGNLCLRLPPTVVGIDVDHYDEKLGALTLKHAVDRWGELPPTVRTTSRTDGLSGIRLYRVPDGTHLHTTITFPELQLGDIEVVQYFHRYAIAWPSIHPTGAQYRWLGDAGVDNAMPLESDLPELPRTWIEGLAASGPRVELSGQVDIDAVLAALPAGAPSGKVIDRMTAAIDALRADPGSRHDTTMRHVLALLRYGEQGDAGVKDALTTLGTAFVGAVTHGSGTLRSVDEARSEYVRMIVNQRGHQLIDATPTIPTAELLTVRAAQASPPARPDDRPGPTTRARELSELDAEFWGARESLATIYAYAHGRYTSPWSAFGVVLCRALATVPPWVTLPPVIGGRGSLNTFVALCGPSGTGKGASGAVAAEVLPVDVYAAKLGSGEGLVKTYGRATKIDGRPAVEQIRTAAVFSVDEVDTIAGLHNRLGSTLLPSLRSMFSGETLGFGYADPTKAVLIPAHSYRATLHVGVQPARAGALLGDADGGTPQRFVWLPTTDPRIGDIHIDQSEFPHYLDVSTINWGAYARHLDIPDSVRDILRDNHIARQRGNGDALDGHALFTREKVAAGIAVLDGRDVMNEQDWHLSGIVMKISDHTRNDIERTLAEANDAQDIERGRRSGVVRDALDVELDARKITRVGRVILRALERPESHTMTWAALRRSVASRDRDVFDDALARLVGRLDVHYDDEAGEVSLP